MTHEERVRLHIMLFESILKTVGSVDLALQEMPKAWPIVYQEKLTSEECYNAFQEWLKDAMLSRLTEHGKMHEAFMAGSKYLIKVIEP